jgi:hypothetical protein
MADHRETGRERSEEDHRPWSGSPTQPRKSGAERGSEDQVFNCPADRSHPPCGPKDPQIPTPWFVRSAQMPSDIGRIEDHRHTLCRPLPYRSGRTIRRFRLRRDTNRGRGDQDDRVVPWGVSDQRGEQGSARLAQSSRGFGVALRSTATSWRRTSSSRSLDEVAPPSSSAS